MWTFNDQSIVKKNHMDILWHKYADKSEEKTIVDADLPAKASVVGRVGLMMYRGYRTDVNQLYLF